MTVSNFDDAAVFSMANWTLDIYLNYSIEETNFPGKNLEETPFSQLHGMRFVVAGCNHLEKKVA